MPIHRCASCQICPQPSDLEEFWGPSLFDLASPICLDCRGFVLMYIAYLPKLLTCSPQELHYWKVPYELRRLLGEEHYRSFLTDGERVWTWAEFPSISSLYPGKLTDLLRTNVRVKWLTEEVPEGGK